MFKKVKSPPIKKSQQVYPSDVTPSGSTTKNLKETHSQSMMNYEIIREKVQSDFQPKTPQPKKAVPRKTLINF